MVMVLFYIAAMIAVLSTLMVVLSRNPVHALLFLALSFQAMAVIFYLMGAPFIAALEVIIYAGAIMVLFIFTVMLINWGDKPKNQQKQWLTPSMYIMPVIMALILLSELIYVVFSHRGGGSACLPVDPKQLAIYLYQRYFLGVELASFLLLSGLLGAFHLCRKRDRSSK